jgi:hypothetical protein
MDIPTSKQQLVCGIFIVFAVIPRNPQGVKGTEEDGPWFCYRDFGLIEFCEGRIGCVPMLRSYPVTTLVKSVVHSS